MPDKFQFDVFLSHSAKDKAVVRPLAERLRAGGVKVWFDEWVLILDEQAKRFCDVVFHDCSTSQPRGD